MAIIKTISDLLWGNASHRTYSVGWHYLYGRLQILSNRTLKAYSEKHHWNTFFKKDNGKGMSETLEVISIAVGGAVGVGNIGGVATAIAVGGTGCSLLDLGCGLFGHDDENGRSFPGGILPFKG